MTAAAANPFQKATRAQAKARVAFEGPTGAGKTWTALEWATALAGTGRIALVDTERGSASLYSDRFDFDVVAMAPPYDPGRLADLLKTAEANGYAAVIVDSLSHFWEGEGGTLDMVDAAAERAKGNSFAGWKIGTPALRHLVDTMLGLDAHLIATMRSKMEYVLETDSRGKQVPRKVGLAPVMRAGVEYEFTLVGDLDLEHRLVITKSRCHDLADEMIQPGRAGEAAAKFKAWLGEGEPLAARTDVDALVGRMNGLGEDLKVEVKREFVGRFGMPDGLRLSQLADATAFVDQVEAGPANSADPAGEGEPASDGQEAGATSSAPVEPSGVNGASAEGPPPAPPEHATPVSVFHDAVKAAVPRLTGGATDSDLRHAVVRWATNGATEDWRLADRDEALPAAAELAVQVTEGSMVLALRAAGGFELRPTGQRSDDGPTIGYLRELIGRIPGLGEARTLTRAKKIARDLNLPEPTSFDAIDGPVLEQTIAEASKKIAEQSKENPAA